MRFWIASSLRSSQGQKHLPVVMGPGSRFAWPGRQRKSITPRGCDRVQAEIAEHMRHQARGLEYFRKGRVANA